MSTEAIHESEFLREYTRELHNRNAKPCLQVRNSRWLPAT